MDSPPISKRVSRAAAFAIISTVGLVMIALFHHPVVGQHAVPKERFTQIMQLGATDELIHGALIAMLAILASALAAFNAILNKPKLVFSGALSAYCLGCTLLGIAMLFDGFVIPSLAGQFSTALPLQASVGELIIRSISITIQVFSKAGLVAQCAAILIWSYAAATSEQLKLSLRWIAWIGAAAGSLPALIILSSNLVLTPRTLMAIFAAHAFWYIAVAYFLYRQGTSTVGIPVTQSVK
jgi:hypothetical protein